MGGDGRAGGTGGMGCRVSDKRTADSEIPRRWDKLFLPFAGAERWASTLVAVWQLQGRRGTQPEREPRDGWPAGSECKERDRERGKREGCAALPETGRQVAQIRTRAPLGGSARVARPRGAERRPFSFFLAAPAPGGKAGRTKLLCVCVVRGEQNVENRHGDQRERKKESRAKPKKKKKNTPQQHAAERGPVSMGGMLAATAPE
jgi:hypothetical protein